MSHASMLKSRRQNQKHKRELEVEAKRVKREAKLAAAGPTVKKEKIKKEKVVTEKVKPTKVKKVKLSKEEMGRAESKKGKAVDKKYKRRHPTIGARGNTNQHRTALVASPFKPSSACTARQPKTAAQTLGSHRQRERP